MSSTEDNDLFEYICIVCGAVTAARRNETRWVERMCYRCWLAAKGVSQE